MKFVLSKNILQGDSLNGIDKITFTQWSLIGYRFNREEYNFQALDRTSQKDDPLFGSSLFNEKKESVYIPQAVKRYPPVHYRNLLEETK